MFEFSPLQVMNLQCSVSTLERIHSLSPSLSGAQKPAEKHSGGDSAVYQNLIGFHRLPLRCCKHNKEGQALPQDAGRQSHPTGLRLVVHLAHVLTVRCPMPTSGPHTYRMAVDHREWKKAGTPLKHGEQRDRLVFYSAHRLVNLQT